MAGAAVGTRRVTFGFRFADFTLSAFPHRFPDFCFRPGPFACDFCFLLSQFLFSPAGLSSTAAGGG